MPHPPCPHLKTCVVPAKPSLPIAPRTCLQDSKALLPGSDVMVEEIVDACTAVVHNTLHEELSKFDLSLMTKDSHVPEDVRLSETSSFAVLEKSRTQHTESSKGSNVRNSALLPQGDAIVRRGDRFLAKTIHSQGSSTFFDTQLAFVMTPPSRNSGIEIRLPKIYHSPMRVNKTYSNEELQQPNTAISNTVSTRSGAAPNLHQLLENARRVKTRNTAYAEEAQFETWSKFLRRSENEQYFDGVIAAIILLNVIQIGVSTDNAPDWKGWLVIDAFFAFAFALEFIVKVWVHTLKGHLCGKMWAWSAFDVFIVVVAIGELAMTLFKKRGDTDGGGLGISVFRIVRLCRLTRIVKILRLPVFKDLLAMIDGLIYGSRTLGWSLCLLVAPVYSIAILMRELVGSKTRTPQNWYYVKPFRTFPSAFFTCFRCIMGDCSSETGQPLPALLTEQFGWMYGVGYAMVICLMTFGLFNVIIAIYVDNIQMAAKRSESHYLQQRLMDEDTYHELMGDLVRMFVSIAEKGAAKSGVPIDLHSLCGAGLGQLELSREDFELVANTPEVQKIFDKLDILPENRVGLFDALDADGGGSLSLAEILNGLTMLRGEPRRADTIANGLILRSLQENQEREQAHMRWKMDDLAQSITVLKEELQASKIAVRKPRTSFARSHQEGKKKIES